MRNLVEATTESAGVFRGRPSATRDEWEAAREADAADLNRLAEAGAAIDAYVAPLWSNADAARCIGELRGFDEAPVYLEVGPGEGWEEALGAVAEAEWLGVAPPPADSEFVARFVHAAAGLEIPLLLPGVAPDLAVRALARALYDDLTPREIEGVLRGEDRTEPDAEATDHARDLLRFES